jgi:glycosyltransferase involved in cell wall biosynthesis
MTPTLSVVIPVFNERPEDLRSTLDALSTSLQRSSWSEPEVVIVDDGSDDPVPDHAVPGARTRVLRQLNRGRFDARRTGISAAEGEYVLLLDSRVTLDANALAWVAERVDETPQAWNGHCLMANLHSPFARFMNVLTHSAWAEYLDDPRTTSFGLEEYDRFPKGTTHFLAPRKWLQEAVSGFASRYEDSRFSNDDTLMLRAIADRHRIHISPEFASVYRNRESMLPFLRHATHRGTVFYDGFSRPETRFFPAVVAAFPLSATGVLIAARRPRMAVALVLGTSTAAGVFAHTRGRPLPEAISFGYLLTPFAAAFSVGIWYGAWLATKARLRS